MAVFQAFRALRPTPERAEKVAALPYDVVTREEATRLGAQNPDSFLHVDRAEIDLPDEADPYEDAVYQKAKENLDRMEADGVLVQEEHPCYYLYELTRNQKIQTGIVGCTSIDDYENRIIKTHELTREVKEKDRIRHVKACSAHTGPVYMACDYPQELQNWMEEWKSTKTALYDFTAEDGIGHRVWIVDSQEAILKIQASFQKISSLYIADGHHRAAAAVRVGLEKRKEHPRYTGQEEFNYFLSVVFPYEQLSLLPYHRVVRDLNGLAERAFIGSLKFNYELMIMPGFPCKPVEEHSMGMYLGGEWYLLRAWPDVYEKRDPVGQLDVSLLQDKILSPVLGIHDPRTDERLCFVSGTHKLKELQEMAEKTGGVAFAMYPVPMERLMAIADAGTQMPPKSTWFEPKLRSGLFIHKL